MYDRDRKTVYQELEIENPEQMSIKANIACKILKQIHESNISLEHAAEIIGIDEQEFRTILTGQFHLTSILTLEKYLSLISNH